MTDNTAAISTTAFTIICTASYINKTSSTTDKSTTNAATSISAITVSVMVIITIDGCSY